MNIKLLLILSALALLATPTFQACTKCNCYELKCSRLQDPDPNCQNKYRDTCDTKEDVTETNFCNIECDCCLETKCYTWNTYPCIMFRTYEFANIIYFILITVNAFILWRLYKSMFSRELQRIPTGEEEEQALTDSKTYEIAYAGKVTFNRITTEITRIDDDNIKNLVVKWFTEAEKLNKTVGSKNITILTILIILYMGLNLFHIFNIFVLGEKPLTYIIVCWVQHLLLGGFWTLVICSFKKADLYMKKIRDMCKEFKAEGLNAVLHERNNLITFSAAGDDLK